MKPDLGEVLHLVNVGREALGLLPLTALPKGRQVDHRGCPLALALGDARVSRQSVAVRQEFIGCRKKLADAWETGPSRGDWLGATVPIRLPATLSAFEEAFEAGAYPELIAS